LQTKSKANEMNSSRSLSLFVFSVLVLYFFSTSASATAVGAKVTFYSDNACSNQIGNALTIPLTPSSECQSVPSNPPLSVVFNCVADGKNTNFTFLIYNGTNDCSGTLTAGVTSDDVTGGCAATQIQADGKTQNVYAHIDCSSSDVPNAKYSVAQAGKELDDDYFEDVIEDIQEFIEKASEQRQKHYRYKHSYIASLFGKVRD